MYEKYREKIRQQLHIDKLHALFHITDIFNNKFASFNISDNS